jgi:hypothetical protein
MSINPFLIYLFGIVDDVRMMCIFIGIISAIAFLGLYISCMIDLSENQAISLAVSKTRNRSGIAAIITISCGVLIPDSKTLAAMVVVPAIMRSEPIQRDVPELYNLAIQSIKDSLKRETKDQPEKQTNETNP